MEGRGLQGRRRTIIIAAQPGGLRHRQHGPPHSTLPSVMNAARGAGRPSGPRTNHSRPGVRCAKWCSASVSTCSSGRRCTVVGEGAGRRGLEKGLGDAGLLLAAASSAPTRSLSFPPAVPAHPPACAAGWQGRRPGWAASAVARGAAPPRTRDARPRRTGSAATPATAA